MIKTNGVQTLALLREVAKPTLQRLVCWLRIQKNARGTRSKNNTGNLKKSQGLITGKSENPTILVGPRVKGANKGWYGHFVHDGVNIYHKGYKRKHKKERITVRQKVGPKQILI